MVKRSSEGDFGAALRAVDDSVPTYIYKLPDPKMGGGVSNWKPCDFMAWSVADGLAWAVDVAWFEVKDTPAVDVFNLKAELRPAQKLGIDTAKRIGIPYWLAVYWRRHRSWTISDAVKLSLGGELEHSISRDLLQTRYGIQSDGRTLTSVLKSILAGEV